MAGDAFDSQVTVSPADQTVTVRQRRGLDIRPHEVVIPFAMLDALYLQRLNIQVAQSGLMVSRPSTANGELHGDNQGGEATPGANPLPADPLGNRGPLALARG